MDSSHRRNPMNKMKSLHEKAVTIANNYLRSEFELVEVLQQIDECKGYLEFKCTSVTQYAIQVLRLSEGTAANLVTVAKKSVKIPELKQALQKHKITLSNARTITPVITPENQDGLIELASRLSKEKLQKEVAKWNPALEVREQVTYVNEERIKMTVGVSEELLEKLRRVQDLESQRRRNACSIEEALEAAMSLYIEKKDPVEKAKRSQVRPISLVPGQVEAKKGLGRTFMPASVLHAVNSRDEGQCTEKVHDGTRCANRRWLQFHHIEHVANGGKNELSNLTTLCFYHHKIWHGDGRYQSR
jgi:hypothetical protein